MTEDLPLALRRGRRASLAQPQDRHHQRSPSTRRPTSHAAAVPSTPSRGSKKRVRFSDPGPAADGASTSSSSTGLTPSLRRTTLLSTTPSSSGKRRRRLSSSDALDHHSNNSREDEVLQVTFLPLRQVIDGRVKRRIRRNGLSEEMNLISAEKRRRAQQAKAEVDALRAELAAKDAQIRRLSGATVVAAASPCDDDDDYDYRCEDDDDGDGDETETETDVEGGRKAEPRLRRPGESIDDLKRQVEELRNALKSPAPSSHASSEETPHVVGWSRDPFNRSGGEYYYDSDVEMDLNGGGSDYGEDDEDAFGESTMAELACSTPSRRPAKNMRHSFPTPPSTGSPPTRRLGTPCSEENHHHQQQQHRSPSTTTTTTTMADAGVQAQLSDQEKRELEEELASLHLEVAKLTSTLETYEAVTARLSDKLAPFAQQLTPPPSGGSATDAILASRSPAVRVEVQLNTLLTTFAARSAALAEIDTSLHHLGFSSSSSSSSPHATPTPTSALASLSASLRAARLELEYLTPGELPLPLSGAGAAVLDLLLSRLRELARQAREDEDVLAEYQHLERSLRRQLAARVDAMDDMRAEVVTLQGKVRLRDLRIRELEAGAEGLRAAVRACRADVRELEGLAQRLEGELDEARKENAELVASSAEERQWEEEERRRREEVEAALEEKLALAQAHAAAVQSRAEALVLLAAAHDRAAVRDHDHDLALGGVREELRAARATIGVLEGEKGALAEKLGRERSRARDAVEAMKREVERVVRMGEGLLVGSLRSPSPEGEDC